MLYTQIPQSIVLCEIVQNFNQIAIVRYNLHGIGANREQIEVSGSASPRRKKGIEQLILVAIASIEQLID